MKTDFLSFYLFGVLISFIAFIIGHISTPRLQALYRNTKTTFFVNLIIGLIILVTLYAIIITGLNTIFLALLLVSILSHFHLKKTVIVKNKNTIYDFRSGLLFLLYFSIIYTIFYFRLNDLNGNLNLLNDDYYYYAGIADYLNHYKLESIKLDTISLNQSPDFYHYFELWLTALISRFTGSSSFLSLTLVVYPILLTIVLFGLNVIASNILFVNKTVTFLLVFIGLFLAPIIQLYYPIGDLLNHQRFNQIPTLISGLNDKLFSVTALICWLFINFRIKNLFLVVLPISIMPFLYSSTILVIPATILTLLILLTYKNIRPVWLTKKNIYISIVLLLIPLLNITIFYGVIHRKPQNPESFNTIFYILNSYLNESGLRLFLGNSFTLTLRLLIPSIPFILLGWGVAKARNVKKNILPVGIIAISFIFSFSAACILVLSRDGYQFFTNLFYPIFYVLFFIIICFGIKQKGLTLYLSIATIVICIIFNIQNPKTTQLTDNTYEILCQEFGPNQVSVGFYNDSSFYKRTIDLSSSFIIPYRGIRMFNSYYFPIDIGIHNKPFKTKKDSIYAYNATIMSPFYKFAKEKKIDMNSNQTKIDFIIQNKFDYLFINKNSEWFLNLHDLPIKKQLLLPDKKYFLLKFDWEN